MVLDDCLLQIMLNLARLQYKIQQTSFDTVGMFICSCYTDQERSSSFYGTFLGNPVCTSFSLGLGCPTKVHMWKVWSLVYATTVRWWILYEGECSRKKWSHWKCALKLDVGTPVSFHCFLLPGHHEVNKPSLPCTPTTRLCATINLKVTEPKDHGLKPLKPGASINSSIMSWWQKAD